MSVPIQGKGGRGPKRPQNNKGGGGKAQKPSHQNQNKGRHPPGKPPHGKQPQQGQGSNQSKSVLTTMLKLVFEKQQATICSAEGVLMLNNFRECPDLASVKQSIDFNTAAFCESLVAVIQECVPNASFISLDSNHISSLNYFLESLQKRNMHDSIRGISAANNHIKDFSAVHKLSKFRNMSEVRFAGNPFASQAGYRSTLTKKVPGLLGIDGEGVQRAPLGLPWPLAATYTTSDQEMLMNLEGFINSLATNGPDACSAQYNVECVFSLNCPSEASFNCGSKNKEVSNALASLRTAIRDRDRNLVKVTGNSATKAATGRSAVCVALTKCLYPKRFGITQTLDSNADVQILAAGQGVKVQQAIITIHGKITWHHELLPSNETPVSMTFDRTFCMYFDEAQGWMITNDCVTLRHANTLPTLMCQSEARLESVAKSNGVPPVVVGVIAASASSDAELIPAVQEVAMVGETILNECYAAANQDAAGAVSVARLIARTNIQTAAAAQLIAQHGANLDAAAAAAQAMGPSIVRA